MVPYPNIPPPLIQVSGPHQCSSADVALQRILDELEAALVEERVFLLRLADVEVIHIYLDEVPDPQVWKRRKTQD